MGRCSICGAEGEHVKNDGCSSTDTLVCVGGPAALGEPGCGRVLSAEDRHWYGEACNDCVSAGNERVAAWRKGGVDPELDDRYGAEPLPVH